MPKPEPFVVPEIKNQVGWRLSEQDKKDLRIIMAHYQVKSLTGMLRVLVQREAAIVRKKWMANAQRRAEEYRNG